jgi:predicted ATPase/DNA-binding SARP family transcriptional activator
VSAPEPEPAGNALCLRLFGPFALCREGKPLPRVRTRQGHWLLALLVLRHGQEIERSWLAGTLWPESSAPRAYHSLRSSLADLRCCLGEDAGRLHSPTPHTLCMDLSKAEVDVLAFDAAVARGDRASLAAAVELYRGPLLEECTEPWAFQEREQTYRAARERLAALALAEGETAEAERHLRLAIAVDPLRESTQRALMQVLAAGGNYAAALLCYRDLRVHLYQELNVEPDAETKTLFQQLRGEARRLSAKRARALMPGLGAGSGSGAGAADRDLAMAPDLPAGLALRDSLDARPHNLPVQRSPLIGREKEVARALELLRREETGLLTLTGAGGSGKTRLGLQVAADLLPDVEHGIFFVGLAAIRDPHLVPSAVAQTLGVRDVAGAPLLESLKAHLKDKQLLLLLDNFEQVLEAAPLVAELLAAAPRLKVLVTSRAALHLRGEKEFLVPPLALPPVGAPLVGALPNRPGHPQGVPLQQYGAVELFTQRAQEVRPEFAVTHENAAAVAEICARLDGLPLAIELAAARIKLLPPQALLGRLESRLKLLTGGARDLPARQQTLRDAIGWSYDLLGKPEKKLLRRLAVFAGGCTLEAVEAACNAGGDLETDVLEGVTSLVDQSLLQREQQASPEARLTMLETIREYGLECLAESGEADAIRRRHAAFFLALAEQGSGGERETAWMDRLEREHDNLRAALAWSAAPGQGEVGLRLGKALVQFWDTRGYWTEGRAHLAGLLALPGAAARTAARGHALHGAGTMAWHQGDYGAARALLEESLAIFRELDNKEDIALSLRGLGNVAREQGDYGAAQALAEESLAIQRELGDKRGIASSLWTLARVAHALGDCGAARALYEESLAISRQLGDKRGMASSLSELGHMARHQGDYGAARALHAECLAISREVGNKDGILRSLLGLARVAQAQGDPEKAKALLEESTALVRGIEDPRARIHPLGGLGHVARVLGDDRRARALYQESLLLRRDVGDPFALTQSLEDLAALAGGQGQARRATQLLGAAQAQCEAIGASPPVADPAEYDRTVAAARGALGEEAFAAAWATGRALSLDEAITYALDDNTPPDKPE